MDAVPERPDFEGPIRRIRSDLETLSILVEAEAEFAVEVPPAAPEPSEPEAG